MYSAALDTSSSTASFAVARLLPETRRGAAHAIRVIRHDIPIGRESAGLLNLLMQALREAGIELAAITHWTIGMGPGSFTGIRVGAALVKGICDGSAAVCRGLPSSLAMAADGRQEGDENICVLTDGRRSEAIISPYRATASGLQPASEPQAIPAAELDAVAASRFVVLQCDALGPMLPASVKERSVVLAHLDASVLLHQPGWEWPKDTAEWEASRQPIYVRPAVFVSPRPPAPVPDETG